MKKNCILFCSWQELLLGLENTLPLGNCFLWRALVPDTVMHLRQPFRSKARQQNVRGHTDKLSESRVKTALILLQHGPLIMDLSKQQAASGGKRWKWDWWPSASAAYQELPSLYRKGIILQHRKTSHISATAMNRDPHSNRLLKTQPNWNMWLHWWYIQLRTLPRTVMIFCIIPSIKAS